MSVTVYTSSPSKMTYVVGLKMMYLVVDGFQVASLLFKCTQVRLVVQFISTLSTQITKIIYLLSSLFPSEKLEHRKSLFGFRTL